MELKKMAWCICNNRRDARENVLEDEKEMRA